MSEFNIEDYKHKSFNALLDAAVDAIIVINHQCKIQIYNKAAKLMFGYTHDEVIGQNVKMLMPNPFHDHHDSYINNYLETKQAKIIGIGREACAIRKDGTIFPIELAVGEVHDQLNPHFVGIIRDLSKQKLIEEQLRIQNEELHQQRERLAHVSRIGTMGEMATGIAHEINQPLSAITTYAQACRLMLESGNSEPAELITTLNKISAQAERAGKVIHRLRSYLKKKESVRELVNINELILDVIKMAEIETRLADIPVETQLDNNINNEVKADSVQIQQVVLNLIRNGIDAMAKNTGKPKIIEISTHMQENDTAVEVTVTDNGSGLDQETAEQVFNPFFTTKATGMGMGLAICRSIIHAHGGKMWFDNQMNEGTRFHFSLPTVLGNSHEDSK